MLVEGRDGAGKTRLVRALSELIAGARTVVMPRPTEAELRGAYFERFLEHMPGPGEIVLFDRSWYSRAGIERVMGFCSDRELEAFFERVPRFEEELIRRGTRLVKIFLDVSDAEQLRRITRRDAPTIVDLEALARAGDYRRAADEMILRTSTPLAPWHVVSTDGDPAETTELAYACIRRADREGEVVAPWTGKSCTSGSASSTKGEGSSGSES